MKERPGVMFYFENRACIDALNDEEAGRLAKGILKYAQEGAEPAFDGVLRIVWLALRPNVDRDAQRYERQCRQKQYAVYCREQDRREQPRSSYEEWYADQMMCSDAVCYPTTTTTTTPTTTPTTTTTPTSTTAATATDPIAETSAAEEEKMRFGLHQTILLTKQEYTELMNEFGCTELHELFLTAEPLAMKRNYDPHTLNWPQYLRFCLKKLQKAT